jgi:hypothetical protein
MQGRMNVSRSFRQDRRAITAIALGVWLFALFVGVAHACGLGEPGPAPVAAVAADASERPCDAGAPPGCQEFCGTDVPLVTRLPSVPDQPDAKVFLVAARAPDVKVDSPSVLRLTPTAQLSTVLPLFLRFAQLRL